MSEINRRDLVLGLSGLVAASVSVAEAQAVAGGGEHVLLAPDVYLHDQMPVKKNANGSETRSVVRGALVTGEAVEVHETTLAIGGAPNPPHAHRASDFILVREGTIAFEHDGKAERVGPGGVILAASGTMHTIRNVGDVVARYFVVGIGRDEIKKLL